MKYTKRQKQILVQQWIDRYIKSQRKMTLVQYRRVAGWMGGLTYAEIAGLENVSPQAVAASVKRDVKAIIKFSEEYEDGPTSTGPDQI